MSETRSHISADDILHVAEIGRRPAHGAAKRSPWHIVGFVLFGICVLVGLANLVSRAVAFFDAPAMNSMPVQEPIDSMPLSENQHTAAASSSYSGIIPAELSIPAIGVSAKVEDVGLNAQGAMQAPSTFTTVGWYKGGSEPGAAGSAVIDGHVNNALTTAGVFEHLDQLSPGDKIIVSDSSGNARTFTVSSVKQYPVDGAPTDEIFSEAGPPELALITCEGTWIPSKKEFDQRLVVYATLAQNS